MLHRGILENLIECRALASQPGAPLRTGLAGRQARPQGAVFAPVWNQRPIKARSSSVMPVAVVIGMSWYGLMSSRDSLRSLHDESLQRILLADSINESVSQMRMQMAS